MFFVTYLSYETTFAQNLFAGVAELADALDLGSSGNTVQVQVLSPVPVRSTIRGMECFYGSPFEE